MVYVYPSMFKVLPLTWWYSENISEKTQLALDTWICYLHVIPPSPFPSPPLCSYHGTHTLHCVRSRALHCMFKVSLPGGTRARGWGSAAGRARAPVQPRSPTGMRLYIYRLRSHVLFCRPNYCRQCSSSFRMTALPSFWPHLVFLRVVYYIILSLSFQESCSFLISSWAQLTSSLCGWLG